MSQFEYIRNSWYPIGFSQEFEPGELQGHTIVSKPFVVWRSKESGQVVGFDDRCCHKRFPLSESDLLEDGTLQCAYHGLRYNTSGQCVAIPAQPDKPIPPQARLRVAPVREQDGMVWLWPGDAEVADTIDPPRTPEVVSEDTDSVNVPEPLRVPANYRLLIENLLDITHFFPLHEGNIGDEANSRIPIRLEEGEDAGNHYVMTHRHVEHYKLPPYYQEWFNYEEVDRVHTHCMVSPGLTRVQMQVAPHGKLGTEAERGYTILHLHLPVDERNLIWRWSVSCNKGLTTLSDPNKLTIQSIGEDFPNVVAQDLWALERQERMMEFPDDDYSELFVKADKAVRRARQVLMDMQRKERENAKDLDNVKQSMPAT